MSLAPACLPYRQLRTRTCACGRTVVLPNPIENLSRPLGLHFDPTYNRLYVVNNGSHVITVHEPDGSPAKGLAVPAFPNLLSPTAIAFRPF